MYYASRLDDRIGLLAWTVAVACACLVFLGVTLPAGAAATAGTGTVAAPAGGAAVAAPAVTSGVPSRIAVPSLGVDAAVRPVALGRDRVLTPPRDPGVLGWWRDSARPGRPGRTVLTGHTVHTGGGALEHLGDLAEGDLVRVGVAGGTLTYRVIDVRVLTTGQVEREATTLFGQDRRTSSLLLVTCTGWDGRAFTRNVLVTAAPVGTAA